MDTSRITYSGAWNNIGDFAAAARASKWGMCLKTFCQIPKSERMGWAIQERCEQQSPTPKTQWTAEELPEDKVETSMDVEQEADGAGDKGGDYVEQAAAPQQTPNGVKSTKAATRWVKPKQRTTTTSTADAPAEPSAPALQTFAAIAAGTAAAFNQTPLDADAATFFPKTTKTKQMVIAEQRNAAAAAAIPPLPTTTYSSYAAVVAAAPTTPTLTFRNPPPAETFVEAAATVSAAMRAAAAMEHTEPSLEETLNMIDVDSILDVDMDQQKFVGAAEMDWERSLLEAEEITHSSDDEETKAISALVTMSLDMSQPEDKGTPLTTSRHTTPSTCHHTSPQVQCSGHSLQCHEIMDVEEMERQWQLNGPKEDNAIASGCAPGVAADGTDVGEGEVVYDEPTAYELLTDLLTSKTSLTELYDDNEVTTSRPKRTKTDNEQ